MTENSSQRRFVLRAALIIPLFFAATGAARAQSGPFQFYSLPPCRVVDTRWANSTTGGPSLGPNSTRSFPIRGNCGVPTTAKAAAINVTVANPTAASYLTLWPSGTSRPTVSTINFDSSDWAVANGAIVPLSTGTNDLSIFNAAGTVNVILDVTGYYQ